MAIHASATSVDRMLPTRSCVGPPVLRQVAMSSASPLRTSAIRRHTALELRTAAASARLAAGGCGHARRPRPPVLRWAAMSVASPLRTSAIRRHTIREAPNRSGIGSHRSRRARARAPGRGTRPVPGRQCLWRARSAPTRCVGAPFASPRCVSAPFAAATSFRLFGAPTAAMSSRLAARGAGLARAPGPRRGLPKGGDALMSPPRVAASCRHSRPDSSQVQGRRFAWRPQDGSRNCAERSALGRRSVLRGRRHDRGAYST